jgi:hypothetical protein
MVQGMQGIIVQGMQGMIVQRMSFLPFNRFEPEPRFPSASLCTFPVLHYAHSHFSNCSVEPHLPHT